MIVEIVNPDQVLQFPQYIYEKKVEHFTKYMKGAMKK